MKSEDPFNMRPLWDALLGIYQEFAQVCDKHGLRYWFAEGNAIGALRHKGFVPWDDDIDLIMPRPDYEKFVSIAQRELPSYLRYWDWRDVPDWRFTMGKVQETRAERVCAVEEAIGKTLSNGLYIDILVLDGFPDGLLQGWWYKLRMRILGAIGRYRRTRFKTFSWRGKIEWVCGALLSLVWPRTRTSYDVMMAIERQMKSVPFGSTSRTWRTGASIRVTMTFPVETWAKTVMREFDEITVPLPIGYDCYLRTQYGDYMQLPPEEKRKPLHSFPQHFSWWLGPLN